uniref:DUF4283 domain-containing protein n=1 Tax=Quercus lobata TaxID=97700 RepID=A0A7N2R7P6_QUELO
MDEITNRYAGLRLSTKECAEVEIQTPEIETGPILVGKFYTKRWVNLESVARVLKLAWKTKESFKVSDLGENRALFLFKTMDDLDKVLLQGPWLYDKYLLILHKLQVGESAWKVWLDRVSFWIQIHGLPTMSQTKEVGMRIGETLGLVEKMDVDNKGFCMGGCLRIRASVKTTEPLCRGRKIRLGNAEPIWVDLKYERLPIFCYWCRLTDHDEKECLQWIQSKESLRPEEKQFDVWMRATSERSQKSQLVEGMRKGGRREDDDVDKKVDRMVSIPRKSTQGWQEVRGLQVGTSEPTYFDWDDAENTRKLENCVEQVKLGLALEKDFEKQLAEIEAGIHDEEARLMKAVGVEPKGMESSLCQDSILKNTHVNGFGSEVSNGPTQQALVGSPDAHGPNKLVNKEFDSEQAQPGHSIIFASASPATIKDANSVKKQGKGPKKTKTVPLATRKENMAGVRSNSCMDAMIVRGVDMDVDREEVGNKRRYCTPLMEIEGVNGNGKRVKVEGEEDPTLVFLMETKFKITEMEGIKRKVERQHGLVVPSQNRGGGLALIWKNTLQVEPLTYSLRHIDVIVNEEGGNKRWRFTGFYGNPEMSKREESWSLIRNLSNRCDLPWVIIGDFNELLHANEKEGGNARPEGQMKLFRDTINSCELRDMGYCGSDFTWSRKLGTKGWVRERLDRAFVSTEWIGMFPTAKIFHVANSVFDHNMLILKNAKPTRRRKKGQKQFRFESMWLKDERCSGVVNGAWEKGRLLGNEWPLLQCLEECRALLTEWNKQSFGHVGK